MPVKFGDQDTVRTRWTILSPVQVDIIPLLRCNLLSWNLSPSRPLHLHMYPILVPVDGPYFLALAVINLSNSHKLETFILNLQLDFETLWADLECAAFSVPMRVDQALQEQGCKVPLGWLCVSMENQIKQRPSISKLSLQCWFCLLGSGPGLSIRTL